MAEPDHQEVPQNVQTMQNPSLQTARVMVDLSELPTGTFQGLSDRASEDDASSGLLARNLINEFGNDGNTFPNLEAVANESTNLVTINSSPTNMPTLDKPIHSFI